MAEEKKMIIDGVSCPFTTERNVDVDIRGLRDSGIPEPYTDGFMYESMQELAKYDGNVVANFHPENIELVETVAPKVKAAGEMGLAAWDHVRPEIAEAETVSRPSSLIMEQMLMILPWPFLSISGITALAQIKGPIKSISIT